MRTLAKLAAHRVKIKTAMNGYTLQKFINLFYSRINAVIIINRYDFVSSRRLVERYRAVKYFVQHKLLTPRLFRTSKHDAMFLN